MQELRSVRDCDLEHAVLTVLNEYYEIIDEARPLSGFFPKNADIFT